MVSMLNYSKTIDWLIYDSAAIEIDKRRKNVFISNQNYPNKYPSILEAHSSQNNEKNLQF